jgi:O-methyltransferase
MPFTKVQMILKKVIPPKQFDVVYNVACNVYDVYRKILDNTVCYPQLLYYLVTRNNDKVHRVIRTQVVLGHTMVSKVGVLKTYDIARSVVAQNIQGDFVECGVARGGCSAVMAMVARDGHQGRWVWMFDSFEGLPQQTKEDGIQKPVRHKNKKANDLAEGYCLGTLEDVRAWFHELMLTDVTMVKGWFQDTLPIFKHDVGDIAVLRLDGDWYESTKCCLENLYPQVVKGGFVIIDDYQLAGCKKAVDEYIENNKLDVQIINDVNGRAYWVK